MTESLKEWYINYKKHKDLFYGKIVEFQDLNGVILIKNNDGSIEKSIVMDTVTSFISLLGTMPATEKITIVALNKHANISVLLGEWKKLTAYSSLTIMFANPASLLDKKWMIKPAVHDGIMDSAALKEGIMSIASGVDFC
jgi:hypothetical protein